MCVGGTQILCMFKKLASSVMGQNDTAVNLCNPLNVRIILTLLTSSRSPRFMHREEEEGEKKRRRTLETESEGGAEVMVTKKAGWR